MKAKILTLPVIELDGTFEEIAEIIKRYTKTLAIIESNPKPTKPKKPKTGASKRGRNTWTAEDVATLKDYYNNNQSLRELAELTGRSVNAVKMKIIKLINAGELSQKKKE